MGKMQLIALICFYFFVLINAEVILNATEEIETPLGKVKGSCMESRSKQKIFAFRGIRYAEAPVDKLRFKVAVPVKSWSNCFDASEEGPACPQQDGFVQSEDCLRLNVYTTMLPKKNQTVKRPVIVYFHPGAFYVFTAQSLITGPQYLLDQDIVLVTVNYRLGSLGFISTGDELAPGNLGLKDQVESLRWVKKNIASFGGDPNSVTITGYSAGGWSVSLHLVSPMTKGLFHRAIAMSGSATYQSPLPTHQMHLAKKQAKFLGCPSNTSAAIIECLYTKKATDIGKSLPQFFEWHGQPLLLWTPVIEPEIPGVERFLTGQPADLIRQGKFHQVPLIAGITRDEFGSITVMPIEEAMLGDSTMFKDLNANWTKLAPVCFWYEEDSHKSVAISESFRKFYFDNKPIALNNVQGLAHLFADAVGFQVHQLVKEISRASSQPVYYYKFTYEGRYSHVSWSNGSAYGVVHHDDLLYLLYDSFFPYFDKSDPEFPIVVRMTTMWAHFAKTGEPIPQNHQSFKNVKWEKFTVENKKYLDIGKDLVMRIGLNSERMKEWEKNFP